MDNEKDIYKILNEWYPDGKFSELDFWQAVAYADGYKNEYYADGDVAEWL